MKTSTPWLTTALCALGFAHSVAAQNIVISNARVIVGDGDVIDRGSIVIQGGRIASVSEGPAADSELPVLDAEGLTAMPGFVDAHRRVIRGDPDEWMEGAPARMQEYVAAGFTTLFSLGDPLEPALELRSRLDAREIPGPRLVVSAPVPLTTDNGSSAPEANIRQTVQDLTLAGADAIESVVLATPGGGQIETLSIAKDEADQQGLLTITHIRTVDDALAAVDGGSGYLSSTPGVGEFDAATARDIIEAGRDNAEYGLVVTSALGSPDVSAGPAGAGNARVLRDAGVIYAFGTATELTPREALRHEVEALGQVFSNEEVIDILTRSAAYAVRRDDALGVLEAGTIGDVVLLSGDPLSSLEDLLNVRVVIRTGRIVFDSR